MGKFLLPPYFSIQTAPVQSATRPKDVTQQAPGCTCDHVYTYPGMLSSSISNATQVCPFGHRDALQYEASHQGRGYPGSNLPNVPLWQICSTTMVTGILLVPVSMQKQACKHFLYHIWRRLGHHGKHLLPQLGSADPCTFLWCFLCLEVHAVLKEVMLCKQGLL